MLRIEREAHLEVNKLVCSYFMDAGRRQKALRSETESLFITHSTSTGQCVSSDIGSLISSFHSVMCRGPGDTSVCCELCEHRESA